ARSPEGNGRDWRSGATTAVPGAPRRRPLSGVWRPRPLPRRPSRRIEAARAGRYVLGRTGSPPCRVRRVGEGGAGRMLFAIICRGRAGAGETRQATRPAHLDWFERHRAAVVAAGPMLDAAGAPIGSLFVIEAADEAAARAFAAADPYAAAGLFAEVEIRPFPLGHKDGARVGG